MLQEGFSWIEETITEEKDSAVNMKSGTLQVYSTPALIALMEYTAWKGVDGSLEAGQTTVGALINAEHIKGTMIGKRVKCVSTLKSVEGKKLTFEIEAYDETTQIGKAVHVRYIVDAQKFIDKINK